MIKLSMLQMLINLTFVKVITQMMINIVLLFASPVLPVIESFESLPLTQSLTDNQQSYNEIMMISKSSWKIHQLKPLSTIKSTINSKQPKQQHVDTYLKLSTRKQSADDQSTITTKASGEMLPSSPGNNSHHGNVLINQSTVFLGGSCNPTTWRKDIAIPMLKALNITYYDPQKDHWEPELIELEDKAKKNSQVLFFVIDNQTRSIASMIEVSFIAATTKKLVLVIDLFPSLEPIINGEPISQYEHDILKGGRKLLMKLVERKGMPVFNQIPAALNYIPIMISRNQTIKSKIKGCNSNSITLVNNNNNNNNNTDDNGGGGVEVDLVECSTTDQGSNVQGDKLPLSAHHILTNILSPYELMKVKEVYDSCCDMYTGCLSLLDTKLAYLMLTGNDLDDNLINNLIEVNLPTNLPTSNNNLTINTSDNITKENYSYNQFNNTINNNNLNHQHYNNHNHHQQNHIHNQQQSSSSSSTTTNLITSITPNHQQQSIDSNHSNHHHHHHHHLNHHSHQHLNDTNDKQQTHHHLNHHQLNNNHHFNNNNLDTTITINFKQFCSLILDYLQSNNLLSKSSSNSTEGSSHFVNINPPPTTSPTLSPTVNFLTSLVNCPQLDDKCDNCDEIDSQREPQQLKDSLNNNLTDSQRIKTADIYLGGSDNPKGWRSSIAIPLIDQSNLTYSMPNINRWDTTGNDLTKLESCQVLLFVIGGQRPELETMILATHYFGQKFKVVLCVQPMPLESVAQDNQISMAAIDDYNRGRAYLSEIARKENIEVFEDLEEAVKCAIKSAKSSAN